MALAGEELGESGDLLRSFLVFSSPLRLSDLSRLACLTVSGLIGAFSLCYLVL